MHSALTLSLAAALALVAQTLSDPHGCTPAGDYILCQNLWGADMGVGNQSTTLTSASGANIEWSTQFTWANGENQVKSYANVLSNTAKGVKLNNIHSAPTTWNWEFTSKSDGLRADVAYDIWTGVAASGDIATIDSSYEIMIWLSSLGGVQAIGTKTTPSVNIAGHRWDVWRGPNQNWQVISFVTTSGDIPSFDADLADFFNYIVQHESVDGAQYIHAIQAGTEPFTGSGTLVSKYSVTLAGGDNADQSSASSM